MEQIHETLMILWCGQLDRRRDAFGRVSERTKRDRESRNESAQPELGRVHKFDWISRGLWLARGKSKIMDFAIYAERPNHLRNNVT
jgi:hypothetical protein